MIRAFVYRPLANGLCRWLGPLEADVMRVIVYTYSPSCSQAEFIEIQRRAILESLHD